MKVINKDKSIYFENTLNCYGNDYPLNDKDINISVITINGRYPDSGYCLNTECKELIYVIDGEGSLYIENQERFEFNKQDVILINVNEAYYWEGHFTIATTCTPAWYPEQHKFK